MAQVSSDGEDDPNSIVLTSLSLTAETTTGTTQLPTLPFDVLPEILCRLPVKLLVQLRCLCKFFNSLISDPKFAKKHLQLSTKRHHLIVTSRNNLDELVHHDSPIPLVFSTSTVVAQTQLCPPITLTSGYANVLCSCDGIICGALDPGSYFLWNPSIRKFKLLPPLEIPPEDEPFPFSISFGYDHFIDNYKVIAVSELNEVRVYTLGTDYWKRIQDIPYSYHVNRLGVFVSGTVTWLAWDSLNSKWVIVSLNLEKESYQNLSKPERISWGTLGVLKECFCIFAISDMFLDVWVMKEYGNKESWTKLYSVPYMDNLEDLGSFSSNGALYISEDDQMLIELYNRKSCEFKLVVYDSKNGTFNILEIQRIHAKNMYIESLISP